MSTFLQPIPRAAKWLAGIIFLAGIIYTFVTFRPNPWNGPVLAQGTWRFEGVVETGLQQRTLFGEDLDLVEVRYGRGSLWSLAGIQGKDGQYESLVIGSTSRAEVREVFQQPRKITLSIPGNKKAVSHSACQSASEPESVRCRITRMVEGGRPPVVLDPADEPTGDLSNFFLQSGLFFSHYQDGFLTWDILPGQWVVEPGVERE